MYPDKKRSFPNVEEGQQEQKETYGVLQHRISTDTFEEIMEKSFSDEKKHSRKLVCIFNESSFE